MKEQEQNRITEGEKEYEYVTGIAYREEYVNVAEYKEKKEKKSFLFLTSLKIIKNNIKGTIQRGRWRWKIENEIGKVWAFIELHLLCRLKKEKTFSLCG